MSVFVFLAGGFGGAIVAAVGAFVSLKMLRPNQAKVIAEAKSVVARDQDDLLERYRKITQDQDTQLEACHTRIDELERREDELEERAQRAEARAAEAERRADNATERALELVHRVRRLEDVLKQHGLDGN